VAPTFVPRGSFFARTSGAENAAVISGAFAGDVTLTGAGAGGEATAVALIGDLIAIARDRAAIVPAPILTEPETIEGLTDQRLAEAV
jgi:homoserine dehydrogenase